MLENNRVVITRRVEKWVEKLSRLVAEGKIDVEEVDHVGKCVKLTFLPLPREIAAGIGAHREHMMRNQSLSSELLLIVAQVYKEQGLYHTAIRYLITYSDLTGSKLVESLARSVSNVEGQKQIILSFINLHGRLSYCYHYIGEYSKAILRGEKALELARCLDDDTLFNVIAGLGPIYFEQGEVNKAISLLVEGLKLGPCLKIPQNRLSVLGCLGEAYISTGQFNDAVRVYEEALDVPESEAEKGSIFTGLGKAYANLGRGEESLSAYQKALKFLRPTDVLTKGVVHKELSRLYLNFGQYDLALNHGSEALTVANHLSHPVKDVDSYLDAGVFQSRIGALILNQHLEASAPEFQFSILMELENIYGILGDYGREPEYQLKALTVAKTVKTPGALSNIYVNLANAYSHNKNYAECLRYYNEALELTDAPKIQSKIHLNLGLTLFLLERYPEAIQQFEQAKEAEEILTRIRRLNGLGVSHASMGNREEALQCLETSLKLAQGSKDRLSEAASYQNSGEIYKELKDYSLAEQSYRKSLDIFADLQKNLGSYSQ